MSQLPIGNHAPDFELKSTDQQSHCLSEALGRGPIVLVFYKAACPASQFTFPHLQKIFTDRRRVRSAEIWGISQDDEEETRQFAGQFGISFDLLIDGHPYAVSSAYGIESVPGIFIVEPDRSISLSDFGFTKSSLNQVAGFEMFTPDDGLPAYRPG